MKELLTAVKSGLFLIPLLVFSGAVTGIILWVKPRKDVA